MAELAQTLFEEIGDAAFIVDPDTMRLVDVNPMAQRMTRSARWELLRLRLDDLIRSDGDNGLAHLRRALQTTQTFHSQEGYVLHRPPDGLWIPVNLTITRLHTEQGQLGLILARDVTERVQAEQRLRLAYDALDKANRTKDRFLATMSHELRTPLTAILGFTGTLLMKLPGPLTAEQEKQLRTVQTSAKHLLSLINDLLDLSKIQSGKVELQLAPLICQGVVLEVATTLRPLAEAKGLRFETRVPPGDLVVRADWRALSQILLNLVNNAIKFTQTGTVSLEVAQRQVENRLVAEFTVSDTGVGIGSEDQAKLFQPFSQVGEAGERASGTGLGLYLSHCLAELMGGTLTCQSKSGQGSDFTLVLPQEPSPS